MNFFKNKNQIAETIYCQENYHFFQQNILASLTNKFISSTYYPTLSSDIVDLFLKEYELIDATSYRRGFYSPNEIISKYNFIKNNCIFSCEKADDGIQLTIYYPSDSKPNLDFVNKYVISSKARVSVMIKTMSGLETQSVKIDPLIIDDLNINYGDKFIEAHNNIISKLNDKRSGIMFFHGDPGTGKSSYIKYLTSLIEKEFIFIPIAFAGELASPDLIPLLLEHKDSILILEDAEKVVQSRDQDANNVSTVSTLLNLSDGILGSMLNIKIIATYNGNKDKVDSALLRPGRLSMDYTFRKLTVFEANRLATKLGKPANFNAEQSLADIYNLGDNIGEVKKQETRKIGFV